MSERPSQEGKLHAGAPDEPVPFGDYELLGLIARGGMAEVYRARPVRGPRRLLAIKVMRPQLAREARFVDMFHREGKLAMLLRNRCIVETLAYGRADDRHFIAMEYIGGRDLTQVIRRCQDRQKEDAKFRVPVPHAVFIAARIAEGLHFAHTLVGPDGRLLNIVNRDVSPSNVRMSYDGDVKLLDFGIAQALMKFTSEIGILKGKFSYMSPEQIRGMPLDARTDVFSTGIILHEMLTTQKLFRGDTEFALMEKVRKAEVPPPSSFNRRVTPELDAIVLRALARDVADRYQSAQQLAHDLDNLLEAYRFDPKELRQLMRQLFRKEYADELHDRDVALSSETAAVINTGVLKALRAPSEPVAQAIATAPTELLPTVTAATRELATAAQAPAAAAPPPPASAAPGERRGFWASLFKKRK